VRLVLLLVYLTLLPSSVWAQVTMVAPSPVQRCLTRGEVLLGTPEYPQRAYARKERATVTVDLEFLRPDAAPRVVRMEARADQGSDGEFEAAVRRFIGDYRVPCLEQGRSATLRQEFVFIPTDGRPIAMFATADSSGLRADRFRQCLKHLNPGALPFYPNSALRGEQQGVVVLRVVFSNAGGPPRVEVLDNGGSRALLHSASTHAEDFRLPCHDGAGEVAFLQYYVFQIEGGARVAMRDMSLLTLLRSLKDIDKANVYFDFNAMACPFDLQFGPRQPHAPNMIGEVGDSNPERRFFLDWLSRQQLELPRPELNALLSQEAVVSVPCTVLNLGQRSGGGASK
jgi:hypothetical protein